MPSANHVGLETFMMLPQSIGVAWEKECDVDYDYII